MKPALYIALVLAAAAQAQSFEVASIHLHEGTVRLVGLQPQGSRIEFTAMSVNNLVMYAFDIRDFQRNGGPSWADVDRYDIAAKAPGDTAPINADLRKMLQALLAERFDLRFHRATREMEVFALVAAKSGHKLNENPEGPGFMSFRGPSATEAATVLTGQGAPLEMLVNNISNIPGIDRPVVDRSGLDGKYDFVLKLQYRFTTDRSSQTATGPEGESIFTTLEEQLGLRLEPQREPVEVLVIDSVSRPSEN